LSYKSRNGPATDHWLLMRCREQPACAGFLFRCYSRAHLIPQVTLQQDTCVKNGCRWLHYGCMGGALQELVASWHRLTPDVRAAIMQLVRGGG
jgi:hypothetical protein